MAVSVVARRRLIEVGAQLRCNHQKQSKQYRHLRQQYQQLQHYKQRLEEA
jgi:hypothetical protein